MNFRLHELFQMQRHPKSSSSTMGGVIYPRPFQSKNSYFVYFSDNTIPGTKESYEFEVQRAKYADQELQQATTGSWKAPLTASSGNAIIPTMPE